MSLCLQFKTKSQMGSCRYVCNLRPDGGQKMGHQTQNIKIQQITHLTQPKQSQNHLLAEQLQGSCPGAENGVVP